MEGATVTIDAIRCQKKISKIIVEETKSDYILARKKNQPTLHSEAMALFRLAETSNYKGVAHDCVEPRRCTCLDALAEGWVGSSPCERLATNSKEKQDIS